MTIPVDPIPPERWLVNKSNPDTERGHINKILQSIREAIGPPGSGVDSVVAGTGIDVDSTDPNNPIVAIEPAVLADISTALQPGDNVSELVNDAGYISDAPADGNLYGRLNNAWTETYAGGVTVDTSGWVELLGPDVQTALDVIDIDLSNIQATLPTKQPLDSDLTAIAALAPSNDDIIQRKAGAWTNRTMAQLSIDLGIAAGYQPLDATLTALAGANWVLNSLPVGSGADTVAQVAIAANKFLARGGAGNIAAKDITDNALLLLADSFVPRLGITNTWTATNGFQNISALNVQPVSILFTSSVGAPAGLTDNYLWSDNTNGLSFRTGGVSRTVWHSGNLLNIGTSASSARTALGLGTAAVENIGTSGATVPLLNGANTHSGLNVFTEDMRATGSMSTTSPTAFIADASLAATVTGNYASFRSTIGSVAAAFNTSQVTHYNAQAWTPGAGHTVTTQYGFRAASLSAATTNYSFFAASAAATGRWNFYASGTAANYFAGTTLIGDAVDYGPALQVATVGSTQPAMASNTMASFARSTSAGASCAVAVLSGNTASCGFNFGDTDDEDVGAIYYDHATNQFNIRINAVSARYQLLSNYMLLPTTPAAADNSLKAATTEYVDRAAPNASYRNLFEREGSHTAGRVNGTYAIPSGDACPISGTGTLAPWGVFYFDPADYPTVNGLTTKLRVRGQVVVNDTAPTSTFVIALHPVTHTGVTGAAGLGLFTIGAAVASSAATTITTPAADSLNQVVGSDFAVPAAGWYCLGFVQSTATVAANSHMFISAQLQMRNT